MDEACVAAIPAALTARAQWVVWRRRVREGRLSEVPFRADGGGEARADDPATWARFADALAACRRGEGAGVGFVSTGTDPFVALGLDDCRDPATGRVADWARAVLDRLDTYCEVSPSGTGVRAWVRAGQPPLAGPGRGRGRHCPVTGRRLPEYPGAVKSHQAAHTGLYEHIFVSPSARPGEAEGCRRRLYALRGMPCPLCRRGGDPERALEWTGVSLACARGHGWSSASALRADLLAELRGPGWEPGWEGE